MRACGRMICGTDSVSTQINAKTFRDLLMKASGQKAKCMAKAIWFHKTGTAIRVSGNLAQSMAKANSLIMRVVMSTLALLKVIFGTAMEILWLKTAGLIRVLGTKIKCKVSVDANTHLVTNMKVSGIRINDTELELSIMKMERFTKASGRMINDMAKDNLPLWAGLSIMASGKMICEVVRAHLSTKKAVMNTQANG